MQRDILDGLPRASQILKGQLYLGSAGDAREISQGANPLGITHILNVSDGLVLRPGQLQSQGIATEWIPIADDGKDKVFGPPQTEEEFGAALDKDAGARPVGAWWRCKAFLEEALDGDAAAGSRVLVHCALGVNRSATIVMAWLMQTWSWDHRRALRYVQKRRYVVNPVTGHMAQLAAFQQELGIPDRKCSVQ
mmetsp:Transcript_86305/g.277033  ORF Transcript_86305/g.277033 Transcript_86305/m.277033 type:complete len:193 (-) Transcript_86305:609-1187(-)